MRDELQRKPVLDLERLLNVGDLDRRQPTSLGERRRRRQEQPEPQPSEREPGPPPEPMALREPPQRWPAASGPVQGQGRWREQLPR